MTSRSQDAGTGPVVIGYDGSDLARLAIEEAGRLLRPGRDALVVCVWQPFDLGFIAAGDGPLDARDAKQVCAAASQTAAAGAALAEPAGFHARPLEVEASPVWKGIVETGERHGASVIVLGSHGHSGLSSLVVGSVARAVADHSKQTVLITHNRD